MTDKQTDYAKSLIATIRRYESALHPVQAQAVLAQQDLIAAVIGGRELTNAEAATLLNVLIPIAKTIKPASLAQLKFIASLCEQKGVENTYGEDLTSPEASTIITTLKSMPNKAAVQASQDSFKRGQVHVVNGEYYRVQKSQAGRWYAKRWVNKGFSYDPSAIKLLSDATVATAEQAAEFGHLYGQCVFCSRDLTDERSVSVGYGPVCADRHALVWG